MVYLVYDYLLNYLTFRQSLCWKLSDSVNTFLYLQRRLSCLKWLIVLIIISWIISLSRRQLLCWTLSDSVITFLYLQRWLSCLKWFIVLIIILSYFKGDSCYVENCQILLSLFLVFTKVIELSEMIYLVYDFLLNYLTFKETVVMLKVVRFCYPFFFINKGH